jgi:hypothetical protein
LKSSGGILLLIYKVSRRNYVRTRNSLQHLRDLSLLLALLILFSLFNAVAQAQTITAQPRVIASDEHSALNAPKPIARDSEMYCAGYIEQSPNYNNGLSLIGGEQEQEKNSYAFGDYVYLSGGAQAGVHAGQEFTVVRPRGSFKTELSAKRGSLGVFTQELGRLRVVKVEDKVSVAQVVQSCEMMLLGDLLKPVEARVSPPAQIDAASIDRFADPSGKQRGHIVLARDAREMVTRDEIVYIDLGAEDNLRAGDRLTVFRQAGKGRVVDYPEEITPTASGGFESDTFKGGKFSNEAQRMKKIDGEARGTAMETPEIKHTRPQPPRKIVGELVVLNVQGRTATAIVTRVAQEIHTGDEVEVK